MSMSVQTMRGVTPRGQGTSGTTAPSSSAPGTGSRRGTGQREGPTPKKHQEPASLCGNVELPPGIPKFNLTIEQELEILERLETRNYIRGGGLYQFLPNDDTSSGTEVPKPKCKQNLMGAFESEMEHLRVTASTLHNDSVMPISEMWNQDPAKLQGLATRSNGDSSLDKVDDLEGDEIPEHCKKLDELMLQMDNYKKLVNDAVSAVFEARFAELFPQGMRNVIILSLILDS